ncbi:MAG: alpha/beta hydrolase, partial [Bowdeniella nasicola]|nr:alpha/beta hydrolase [Bowdeniella nasicola]
AVTLRASVLDAWVLPVTSPAAALRRAWGESPVRLVGHSLGGLAALEWALTFPEQVCELVLLDPTTPRFAPLRTAHVHAWCAPIAQVGGGLATLAAPLAPSIRRCGYRLTTGRIDPLPRELVRHYYRSPRVIHTLLAQWATSRAQARRVGALLQAGDNLAPGLPLLHLVATGGQRAFAREQRTLAALLGAELQELSGLSHLFPLTHPHLVAERIRLR